MAGGCREQIRFASPLSAAAAWGLAFAGVAACSNGGLEPPAIVQRPAPRALGDSFCVEPPAIEGELRPAWSLNVRGETIAVTALAADADGGLWAGGMLADRLEAGNVMLRGTADGQAHPFLLRVDAGGTPRWGKTFPGVWFPAALRVTADHRVNVVAMSEGLPVDFGAGSVPEGVPIGTFDAAGELVGVVIPDVSWANSAMPPAFGPAGEIALTDFASSAIAVFDGAGTLRWQKPALSLVQGLFAFDADANLIAGAAFFGGIDWLDPPPRFEHVEGVIAKFDTMGTLHWLRRLGTEVVPVGLSVSGGRALAVTHAVERPDAVITSFEDGPGPEPAVAWKRSFPLDTALGAPVLAAALPDGGAFVFSGTEAFADFGLGPIPRPGAYLLRVDGQGVTVARAAFESQQPFPMQVVADAAGGAYLAGGFLNVIDLGGGPLRGEGSYGTGTFLAKVARGSGGGAAERRCAPPKRPGVVLGDPLPMFATGLALAGDTVAVTTGTEVLVVDTRGGEPRFLASRQPGTIGLAVDAKSVYWANAGTDTGEGDPLHDGGIWSAPIAGGTAKALVGDLAAVAAMAIDDRNVYYAVGPVRQGTSVTLGKLMSIPLEGGAARQIAAGFIEIGPLAARAGTVILAGRTASTGSLNLLRIDAGGDMETLAISDRDLAALVVNDDTAFWVEFAEFDTGRVGQLRSVPLAGGPSRVLAGPLDSPSAVAVLGDDVYYNALRREGMELVRLPFRTGAGGRPSKLARGFASIGPISSDGMRLAWVERTDDITWALVVERP
jgi:hypothetical protein